MNDLAWQGEEEAMSDYDKSIHSNPSGDAWAKFYVETYPDADLDTMRGWFANAMMAMHDYLYATVIESLKAELDAKRKECRWYSDRNQEHIATITRLRDGLLEIRRLYPRTPCMKLNDLVDKLLKEDI